MNQATPIEAAPPAETFLRDTDLAARYNVSRATVWRWQREATGMPRPLRLSPATTRWRLSDILKWEAQRAAAEAAQ